MPEWKKAQVKNWAQVNKKAYVKKIYWAKKKIAYIKELGSEEKSGKKKKKKEKKKKATGL